MFYCGLAAVTYILKGCSHLWVGSDPSVHSGEDTMLSVVYSWQQNVCLYPPMQILKVLKTVDEHDDNLLEEVQELAAAGKLQREKAYAQLKGWDNMLSRVGFKLEDFKPEAAGICMRPAFATEVRAKS